MQMPQIAAGSGEHPIGWIEFPLDDQAKTREFYAKAFGWEFQEGKEGYYFFEPPKGLCGGFNAGRPAEQLNTVVYIYVADIAKALEAIVAAGGAVHTGKTYVAEEGGGAIALFTDPAGVVMGLADMEVPPYEAPDPFSAGVSPTPNMLVSLELYGGSLDATAKFYKDIFGWETLPTMEHYMLYNTGSGIGGVFQGHTPAIPVMPYIWVDDVAAALERIEAAGGKRSADPMVMEGMPVFGYFTDPSGVHVGLLGPNK
jgi:predicted enzyme related to lactoylglutathione lyase